MVVLGRALALGLVSASVVTAACSSSSSSTSSDAAPPPVDPGVACDAAYDAIAAIGSTCGLALPSAQVAANKARYHTACVAALAYPGEGVTGATVKGCATALGSASCRGANPMSATCADLPGTLANGTACNGDSQCSSGACIKTPGDGGTTPDCGTCGASAAVGAACAPPNNPCSTGNDCVKSICVPIGSVGAGGDCLVAADCTTGLICDSAKKCAALGGSGKVCGSDSECQMGLSCINKACATALAVGAACTNTATGGGCGVGLACDFVNTKKCVAIAYAAPGAPCGFLTTGVTLCLPDPLAFGNGCHITDTTKLTGTCPTVVADGQPCPTDGTTTCDYGATCDNGVCTLAKAACK